MENGKKGLLAERAFCFVFGPFLDTAEAEPVQAAIQIRNVVKSIQADGAFGVRRCICWCLLVLAFGEKLLSPANSLSAVMVWKRERQKIIAMRETQKSYTLDAETHNNCF